MTARPLFKLSLLLSISVMLFLSSCQKEEDFGQQFTAPQFTIPEFVLTGDSVELKTTATSGNVEWVLSSGEVYFGNSVQHIFTSTGAYSIEFRYYENAVLTYSTTKNIEVYRNYKYLETKKNVTVQEAVFTEGTVILYCTDLDLQLPYYILLSDKLAVLDEGYNIETITNNLKQSVILGDSVIAVNSFDLNKYLYHNLKSTGTALSEKSVQPDYTGFNTGVLYSHHLSDNHFVTEFFNEDFQKLWTKSYDNYSGIESEKITNINNILYFTALNIDSDKLVVEQFKNPSVVFNRKEFQIGIQPENREELFVLGDEISGKLLIGYYDRGVDASLVYSIDKNCNLSLVKEIEGRFSAQPQYVTQTGKYILKDQNKTYTYNSQMELIYESEKYASGFGICSMGDNQILKFENTADQKVLLSLLDKYYNTVVFE